MDYRVRLHQFDLGVPNKLETEFATFKFDLIFLVLVEIRDFHIFNLLFTPSLTSWSGVGEGLSEPKECLRDVEAVWSPRAWESVCPGGAGSVSGLSHWVVPVGMCQ